MKGQELTKFNLPDSPGVYYFLGSKKEILYIGKATSLKDRVKSYFSRDLLLTRGPLILKMVGEFDPTHDEIVRALLQKYPSFGW